MVLWYDWYETAHLMKDASENVASTSIINCFRKAGLDIYQDRQISEKKVKIDNLKMWK